MWDILTIWSESAALSLAIWIVLAMVVLYFGRPHAHQLLRSTGRAIDHALRLAAASLRQLEKRVSARNRDVLLAQGREATEHAIEREFTRVKAVVDRELAHYPDLHRRLEDTLEKVESDYQNATHNPPLPPEWSEVASTISALPSSGDPAVTKILNEIKSAVENARKETLKTYQKNTQERHKILGGMAPHWRSLKQNMEKVQQKISGLDGRAAKIDRHMADYEAMRNQDDKAVHQLTASSLTQFFIAALVLAVSAFGGLVNFHLIALPMSEMVGGGAYFAGMPVSEIAALVIIMVEISMGIFFLEALGITSLFPMIGRMDDRLRKRMGIAALVILVLFASIEASLAYLRDLLIMDQQALTQSLAGAAIADQQFRWIPSIAQMMLGFILPFALAFVGIPLESFVQSLRTVLGLLFLGLLRAARVVLRMVGVTANHLSKMLISVYDLFVMLPLGIERMVTGAQARSAGGKQLSESADDTDTDTREHGAGSSTRSRSRRGRREEAAGGAQPEPTPTEA
ncbi:hypothetical protein H0Z60_05950 [Ectothiorhodospiraceae bacterium WFHF3C12]|nr:hypothetical protein [Ectothiorhodospiraceae bacterium WFHF3C12]